MKLTGSPEGLAVALTENPMLPYCALGAGPKVMVCDFRFEPCGRMVNVPETGVAALYAGGVVTVVLFPACDAVMVQVPVLVRATVAEDTPLPSIVDEPAEQGPDALKLTNCMSAVPPVWAVAVTIMVVGCVLPSTTELGNGPRAMVCP
ncbi:MAG TPA: hypothetical protein VJS11_08745, partial [Acidobacteriaceae bacterium]|nr:hypothetical protein [Acidobacteriaceae bacterium]